MAFEDGNVQVEGFRKREPRDTYGGKVPPADDLDVFQAPTAP